MGEGDDWLDVEGYMKVAALEQMKDVNDEIYQAYQATTTWEIIDIRDTVNGSKWVIARNYLGELYKLSDTDKRDFQIGKTYNHVIRECRVDQIVTNEEVHYRKV